MTASWSGSPRTWVDQETPTALQFNTEFRDRFDFLSVHTHTGADGDGSAAINPDTVTFDDSGATPDAPGANKVVVFSESETAKVRAGAAGVATDISLATHTHTQAEGSGQVSISPTISANNTSYSNVGESLTQTPSDSTGSSQYAMCMTATTRFTNANGSSGTVYLNLEVGSSQVEETSAAMPAPISSVVDLGIQHLEIAGANSSTTYDMDVKKSGSTNVNGTISTLSIMEVQCL
jgi:hypothetical protein